MRAALVALGLFVSAAACTPARDDRDDCVGAACSSTATCAGDTDCSGGKVCERQRCVVGADLVVCRDATCHQKGQRLELKLPAMTAGATAQVVLTLKSVGARAAKWTGVTLTGPVSRAGEGAAFPVEIAASATLTLPILFAPEAEGSAEGTVVVASDDAAEPQIAVVITAVVNPRPASCELEFPSSHDFATALVGTRMAQTLLLKNLGTEACLFGETVFTGTDKDAFTVDAKPTRLEPGATSGIDLTWRAAHAGPTTATLAFSYRTNGQATDRFGSIALTGSGEASGACSLELTPGTTGATSFLLDFGVSELGAPTRRTITIRNPGAGRCRLENARLVATIGNDPNTYRIVTPPPATLAANASATIEVELAASTEGTWGTAPPATPAYALWLDTGDESLGDSRCRMGGQDDGPVGCAAWTLIGRTVGALVTIRPPSLAFGNVTPGCVSSNLPVSLSNPGTTPLTVHAATAPSPFQVVSAPSTIAPGATDLVQVRLVPSANGTFSGNLSIDVERAGSRKAYTVALTGSASAATTGANTFIQSSSPRVDVLFVVDDSGSMSEEQTSLASSAAAFITAANDSGSDYHLGVVTTDMVDPNRSGRLATISGTNRRFVTPGVNALAELQGLVNVGTEGDFNECGLDAFMTALTPPLVGSTNAGFLRPDARLGVIILSDEEDYSLQNPQDYEAFLDTLKGPGSAALTSLSAIVGDLPAGCSSAAGTADPGTRYVHAQAATGGQLHSICSGDWTTIAESLAHDLFALDAIFLLTQPADGPSVRVKVNGVAAQGWAFIEASNAIVFEPTHVPAAGDTISVTYGARCVRP